MNKNEIIIINKDWDGICVLENSQRLARKDILNENRSSGFQIMFNTKIITYVKSSGAS